MTNYIAMQMEKTFKLPVFINPMKQNFKPPAITIQKKSKEIKKQLHQRFLVSESYYVEYFLSTDNQGDLLLMEDKLFQALEYIPVGDAQLALHDFLITYTEKSLQVTVSYAYYGNKNKETLPLMKTLEPVYLPRKDD